MPLAQLCSMVLDLSFHLFGGLGETRRFCWKVFEHVVTGWLLDWHEIRVSGRSINLGGQAVMQWLLMEQAFFLILPKSGEGGGAMAHHAPLVSTGLLKCDDFKTTAQHLSIMWSETNLRTKSNLFDLDLFFVNNISPERNSVCKKNTYLRKSGFNT